MAKNLFVVGLDDFHLAQLQSLRRADEYRFHSLTSYKEIKCGKNFPVRQFLECATRTLSDYKASIDGIIGFWDFPVSTVLPIIRSRFDLAGPSLTSVLKCEHKFWSRLVQQEVVPEMIPPFQQINPFAEEPEHQLKIGYPFWLKPVKSVLSHLGFLIRDPGELRTALQHTREHIGRYAKPFNFILDHAELPNSVREVDGYHCIAEGLISQGQQCTLEGYVHKGEVVVYGIVDSIREGVHLSSFARYQYPSRLPDMVQQRMIEATRKVLKRTGYDNSPFNIEFYWNEEDDSVHLLEINTRISKSHCPLFKMVDGEFHHDVMIDVALGRNPSFPYRQGNFTTAAKFMIRRFCNGRVSRIPGQSDIDNVKERFPETDVLLNVQEGLWLSDLKDQDSYSYEIADLFMGAESHERLLDDYGKALDMLPFQIDKEQDYL